MPLDQTLSYITLGVSNLDISKEFYLKMGFREAAKGSAEVAFYRLGHGQFLALFPRSALAEDAQGAAADGNQGISWSLSQNVSDRDAIDPILEQAERSGGTILRRASKPPWGGLRGYFADPDGFVWEIAWNPDFEFNTNEPARKGQI